MSQQMINIGGDPNDANYRYKMPPLQVKIEGRGNGIKTILVNIVDVCKHLHTQPEWCTRFFGIEMGAVSRYDETRDVGIVHGQHEAKTLQQGLKKYINGFILCPKCHLPELQQKVHKEKQLLLARCASCGWKGEIKSPHKVKQFIINSEITKHSAKSSNKDKVVKKKSSTATSATTTTTTTGTTASTTIATTSTTNNDNENNEMDINKSDHNNNNDDHLNTEMDDMDVHHNKEIKININALGGDNDEVWSVRVDEQAVAQRKLQELESLANKKKQEMNDVKDEDKTNFNQNESLQDEMNEVDEDQEEEEEEEEEMNHHKKKKLNPYTIDPNHNSNHLNDKMDHSASKVLKQYIQEHKNNIVDILHEIKRLCLAREYDEIKKIKMTFDAISNYKDEKTFMDSLIKNASLLKYLNKSDNDSRNFFGVLEEIIVRRNHDKLLPKTYKILQCIYDHDIANEEQIIRWYESATDHSVIIDKNEADNIRSKAKVFYEWLKNEQEEEEEDGDEEEEEEEQNGDEQDVE